LLSGRETVGSSNREDDVSLKFCQQLLLIDENLVAEDAAALKFLCTDLLPFKKLESVKSAVDIFQLLMAEEYLNKENTFLLAELLYRIKCHSLLKKLGYTKEKVQECLHEKGTVSPYRQMLCELSENITNEMLKHIIFLLQNCLPKRWMTHVCEERAKYERQGLSSENNVQMLEEVCTNVSPDLLETVNCYKRTEVCNFPSLNALWSDYKHNGEKAHGFSFCLFLLLVPLPQQENTLPVKESSLFHTGDIKVFTSPQVHRSILPTWVLVVWGVVFVQHVRNTAAYSIKQWKSKVLLLVMRNCGKKFMLGREMSKKARQVPSIEWVSRCRFLKLKAKQMYAKVKEYSKKDHSNMDCFVCFIFSHGEKDKIKGVDHQLVNIKDLLSCFSGSNCPSLAGKPKLFFIQVCQGSAGHPAITVKEDFSSRLEADATPMISIPDQADILIGMATVEDYECYHCTKTGSIYVQCLC
ncbi:CASPA protein, partial [Herpetotheres cachinnans]|nr:CASPA protein [Herpetotheres cachinnans]